MTRPLRRALGLGLAIALALPGCGGPTAVRRQLEASYGQGRTAGDTQTWETATPAPAVVQELVTRVRPIARATDGGIEHLRYDDDIVLVVPGAGGGSRITAEDLDGRFEEGAYAHLGPGFTPGSPDDDDGGPGDVK